MLVYYDFNYEVLNTLIDKATYCPLTGVYSRTVWDMDKDHIPQGTWFYYCDLNRLKAINDRYGHVAGDAYIQRSINALRDCFKRETDRIYRLGGDEFIVVSDYEPSASLATLHKDVAIGYAQITHDVDEALAQADAMMYTVKAKSRAHVGLIQLKRVAAITGACIFAILLLTGCGENGDVGDDVVQQAPVIRLNPPTINHLHNN